MEGLSKSTVGISPSPASSHTTCDVVLLTAERDHLKARCEHLEKQLVDAKVRLSYQFVQSKEGLLVHYTGLPGPSDFDALLELVQLFNIKYYCGWTVKVLPLADQLLMTLMKLRCNFSALDLAVRFDVSTATVTNVTRTFIKLLHELIFEGMMMHCGLPSLRKAKSSLPECFRPFQNCRIVLDCTEVQIAIPGLMANQCSTFSHYKQRNTFKALVGVAPNGSIIFASELFPGSVSDKEIVRHSGVLETLKPGDMVMADKGFLIRDLLPAGVSLNLPPFLETPQFTPVQARQTVTIARARIHVERAIQRIKQYHILSFIPHQYRTCATEIFQLCTCLVNLESPLLKEVMLPSAQRAPSSSALTQSAITPAAAHSTELQSVSPGVVVNYLTHGLSQSRIDGRTFSHACTVISALVCRQWLSLEEAIDVVPGNSVPQSLVDGFVAAMRRGNAAYDDADLHGSLLSVYDALDVLSDARLTVRPHSDFGLHCEIGLVEKLQMCAAEATSAATVVAGILVQSPFSVSLVFLPSGHALLYDSHSHGDHGGLIAVLVDWADSAKFIALTVGAIDDAHLCLLRLSH